VRDNSELVKYLSAGWRSPVMRGSNKSFYITKLSGSRYKQLCPNPFTGFVVPTHYFLKTHAIGLATAVLHGCAQWAAEAPLVPHLLRVHTPEDLHIGSKFETITLAQLITR
jgi:hypothetical protein